MIKTVIYYLLYNALRYYHFSGYVLSRIPTDGRHLLTSMERYSLPYYGYKVHLLGIFLLAIPLLTSFDFVSIFFRFMWIYACFYIFNVTSAWFLCISYYMYFISRLKGGYSDQPGVRPFVSRHTHMITTIAFLFYTSLSFAFIGGLKAKYFALHNSYALWDFFIKFVCDVGLDK